MGDLGAAQLVVPLGVERLKNGELCGGKLVVVMIYFKSVDECVTIGFGFGREHADTYMYVCARACVRTWVLR